MKPRNMSNVSKTRRIGGRPSRISFREMVQNQTLAEAGAAVVVNR
jgi:hypothetical protein